MSILRRPAEFMVICHYCQTLNRPDARFCAVCGRRLEAAGDLVVDLRSCRLSDRGRVRARNEDYFLALELVVAQGTALKPMGLYVIADGMGGHEQGEVASALAVQAVAVRALDELFRPAALIAAPMPDPATWLRTVIQAANVVVYEQAQQAGNNMGTTVVAALVIGDQVTVGHVGDSRAYKIGRQGMTMLTTDHSLLESLIAAGRLSRQEARRHPRAGVIVRTIGDKREADADVQNLKLESGECLLLCSDGLTHMLSDEEILGLIMKSPSIQAAGEALIAGANAAGGEDNITVILVQPKGAG